MVTLMRTRGTWTGVAGAPAYSNLYWLGATGLAQFVHDAHEAWFAGIEGIQRSGVSWATDPNVAFIDSVTGDITGLVSVVPGGGGGDSTADMLPPSTQALGHLRTGTFQGGREIRGRVNVPYLTEASGDSLGQLTTAAQTVLVDAFALLMDPEIGASLVVWSRLTGAAPAVEQITVPVKFAVLRSRRD